jgi:putative NIF3 family GTP cyclohydrolase 1 type 2
VIETTEAVRAAMQAYRIAVRAGKAQKAQLEIAKAISTLPTQTEVDAFTRRVRISQGSQDPTLIDNVEYKTFEWVEGRGWSWTGTFITKDFLLATVAQATEVHIQHPNRDHYGTAVHFVLGDRKCRAATRDWALSETYLSS